MPTGCERKLDFVVQSRNWRSPELVNLIDFESGPFEPGEDRLELVEHLRGVGVGFVRERRYVDPRGKRQIFGDKLQ